MTEKKRRTKSRGNGTGSAYKRGGSWVAQVIVDWRVTAEDKPLVPVKVTKGGFKTRDKALQYCPILKAEYNGPSAAEMTLQQVYDAWEPWYSPRVDPSTMAGYRANSRPQDRSTTDTNNRNGIGIIHKRETKQIFVTCKRFTNGLPNLGRLIITNRTKQPTVFNLFVFIICRHTNQTRRRRRIPTRIMPTRTINARITIINLYAHWLIFNQDITVLTIIGTNRFIIFRGHISRI